MSIMEMQNETMQVFHENRFSRLYTLLEDEFKFWCLEENKFWKEILQAIKGRTNSTSSEISNVATIDDYLNVIEIALASKGDPTPITEFQSRTPLPFHDEHLFRKKLIPMALNGQFSLARFIFEVSLSAADNNYLKSYNKDLQSIEENFKTNTTNTLKKYDHDLAEKISELNDSIDKTEKEIAAQLDTMIQDAQQNIAKTVSAANSAILSAEPVKYWLDREIKHRDKAKRFLWLIGIASFAFLSVLVTLSMSVYRNGEEYVVLGLPITLPAEKFSIALLIIATTSAIWIIRVLVKLMMTNLALEIEALERSTMIRTYIAMDNAKAEQAAEIRMLFYSTLFKPSNNSLTDDSTSPEYIRIIEAMLQKKT